MSGAEVSRNKPPRKKVGDTSASMSALKARALDMVASGTPIADVARAVGKAPRTVRAWAEEIHDALDGKLDGVKEAIADGAAEARMRLVNAAPEAASEVLSIMRAEEGDPQLLAVKLRAAMTTLDRCGVKAGIEVNGSLSLLDEVARVAASMRREDGEA